jgi:Ca2+-binding RTX toxin-like protein
MPVNIVDSVVGTGEAAVAGARLIVDYVGTYVDATTGQVVTFDQSDPRPAPFEFQLGARQVIAGWDQGLLGMRVGGERQLVISADLAYGAAGSGTIPPNTELTFQVRLHAVETFPAASYFGLTTARANSVFKHLYGSRVASQAADPFADVIAPDPVVTNYWIDAFAGADLINGGQFSDVVFAGEGNDSVNSDAGNDVLIGGDGDDFLNGAAGDRDAAVYHGMFADYQFAVLPPQPGTPVQFSVSDATVGRDGVDQLQDVERLLFVDRFVTATVVDGVVQIQDVVALTAQPTPQSTPMPTASVAGGAAPAPASSAPAAPATAAPLENSRSASASASASAPAEDGVDAVIAPMLKAQKGAALLQATDSYDRILFSGEAAEFGRSHADKVRGFDGSRDQLVLDRSDFRGQKQLSLLAVEGKKQLKLATWSGASLVYRKDNGDLYWNQNGIRSGWGSGGCFARLDDDLALTPSNFVFG